MSWVQASCPDGKRGPGELQVCAVWAFLFLFLFFVSDLGSQNGEPEDKRWGILILDRMIGDPVIH